MSAAVTPRDGEAVKDLLWLDLETTGLKPYADDILMVAAARTDEAGNITESREWVVCWDRPTAGIDQIVVKMHTENGLWDRARSEEGRRLSEVRSELAEFIGPSKPILAGSSIHFDRGFLQAQMPAADAALHYRMLDVSALKVAAGVWGLPEYRKVKKHLALDDVKASIAEFMHWKRAFGR